MRDPAIRSILCLFCCFFGIRVRDSTFFESSPTRLVSMQTIGSLGEFISDYCFLPFFRSILGFRIRLFLTSAVYYSSELPACCLNLSSSLSSDITPCSADSSESSSYIVSCQLISSSCYGLNSDV